MISVPVLCMKVFAEERHNKTDQLTLTAPVTVGQIVVGKYLALLTIFGITTLIICLYPLILSAYGKILIGETFVAILGYFLYGATAIFDRKSGNLSCIRCRCIVHRTYYGRFMFYYCGRR